MSSPPKIDASQLGGVSETALMTLNGRAHQASLPGAILHDPMAIELVDSIDFDFDKFGRKGQEMALRSLAVDACAVAYLTQHPRATVVALAEGFQTSFWRVSDAIATRSSTGCRWTCRRSSSCASVYCRRPPADHLARAVRSGLQLDGHHRHRRGRVHHRRGLADVSATRRGDGSDRPVRQALSGRPDVLRPTADDGQEARPQGNAVLEALPGATDAVQPEHRSAGRSVNTVPGIKAVHDIPMPKGRGFFFNRVWPAIWHFGPTKRFRGAYTLLEFG